MHTLKWHVQSIHKPQTPASMVMSEESLPLRIHIHKQYTHYHCTYLQMQTCQHKKPISSEHTSRQPGLASSSPSLLFPFLSGPFQCWAGNEFENCPISFALSEISLSTGNGVTMAWWFIFLPLTRLLFFFPCRTCNKVIWCLQQISHTSLSCLNVWLKTLGHTSLCVPLCCEFRVVVLFVISPASLHVLQPWLI